MIGDLSNKKEFQPIYKVFKLNFAELLEAPFVSGEAYSNKDYIILNQNEFSFRIVINNPFNEERDEAKLTPEIFDRLCEKLKEELFHNKI